jgi:hypothetical protein
MSIALCNGYLEVMEALNHGVNHSCAYGLSRLAEGESLEGVLVAYLSNRGAYQERFPVQLAPLGEDWKVQVEALVNRWFFEGEFSPRPSSPQSGAAVAKTFVARLEAVVENSKAFEVIGEATMLPELFWEAVAFSDGKRNWLLEFGWSD